MKYTALIFDMDGTIVHNMPIHNQAWKETLAEAGVQIDMDEFHRTTVGKKTHEIMRLMLGTARSEADLLYWGERKELLYRERFSAFRQPMPGLLSLLEQAQSSGLSMAIASAAPPENISFILDELDLPGQLAVRGHCEPGDEVAVAAQVFGGAVDDDIHPVFDWTLEIRRHEGVVDDAKKPSFLGQGRDRP